MADVSDELLRSVRDRYVNLLCSTLTMSLWEGRDGRIDGGGEPSAAIREVGGDWPALAHTMIGDVRLQSLRRCVEDVLARGVPGDFIETGVWRGGACILMRGILAAYGDTSRTVWVADSFEGLPPPDVEKYPQDAGDLHHTVAELSVSQAEVMRNFECYGLSDEQVRVLQGWFKDTLPSAPIDQLAIARLDGDMYESTMDCLVSLYPKVSPGGYLIVDDYVLPGCRAAVEDYREDRGITDTIIPIDWAGAYWIKSG